MPQVHVTVSADEKASLEAQAAKEGISASTLMYRRIFNKPDAEHKRGRRPRHRRDQEERLFDKAG